MESDLLTVRKLRPQHRKTADVSLFYRASTSRIKRTNEADPALRSLTPVKASSLNVVSLKPPSPHTPYSFQNFHATLDQEESEREKERNPGFIFAIAGTDLPFTTHENLLLKVLVLNGAKKLGSSP